MQKTGGRFALQRAKQSTSTSSSPCLASTLSKSNNASFYDQLIPIDVCPGDSAKH